jgi:hypothetical protein
MLEPKKLREAAAVIEVRNKKYKGKKNLLQRPK